MVNADNVNNLLMKSLAITEKPDKLGGHFPKKFASRRVRHAHAREHD